MLAVNSCHSAVSDYYLLLVVTRSLYLNEKVPFCNQQFEFERRLNAFSKVKGLAEP